MSSGDLGYRRDVLALKSISSASPTALLPKMAAPNAEDTSSFTMVMEVPQSLRDSSSPVRGGVGVKRGRRR